MKRYDFMIVGAGIIGLSIAREIKKRYTNSKIVIIEKEADVAKHSSGRNSGVLHAGFYYGANSLKAKFTRDGNRALKEYCKTNNLKLNPAKKIVVTSSEEELKSLHELYKRGINNGVEVEIQSQKWLAKNFKNIKTFKECLFSPSTATIDPTQILYHLKDELIELGVEFKFHTLFHKGMEQKCDILINAAGLYADKIAKEFGFSKNFTIIPFKGIYLKYNSTDMPIDTNIYPVPNLKNPFLGVHYTLTVENELKIGPTAIPAFWRENYQGLKNFKLDEFLEILKWESILFLKNSFGFRDLALEEIKKYKRAYLISLAQKMVYKIDANAFNQWSKPGIRAQLLDTDSLELLDDFVIESNKKTIHILNAVSPAFTSSFAFARWIVERYI
jgi:L-2-hydroxyglutarate oxidase LhgO